MRKLRLLSVVVPCFNEEDVLTETHKKLASILTDLACSGKITAYELLYVDDGSSDNTPTVLKGIFEFDKNVRVISLRTNSGLQGAISAGLGYAAGDAVVTIDADLQDPPEKITEMISRYEEGYDLCLGIRSDRTTDSFFKRLFAENYYNLMKLLGVKIVRNHGDFRLMSRSLVDEFNNLRERNRFIRALILQLESRYAVVPYKRESRSRGTTKFSAKKMFSFGIDGIVSFTFVPLRIAAIAGVLLFLLGLAGVVWTLYVKIFGTVVPGWTSIVLPIFVLGGFQLLCLGIMGEYIGRLYIEVKRRPLYVVREEWVHREPRFNNNTNTFPDANQPVKLSMS